ncbi:MAG: SocA family protein [Deltaproteobacteria bacterium]|nr:SocA family protein [Deltaproteobacteria bacterium]
MGSNFYRLKLLNAVLYFASKTKKPNLTKILKLLYFLDFTHSKETGYPSINLIYFAWEKGPVPKDFYEEVKDGNVPDDFADKLTVLPSDRWEQTHPERKEYIFKPLEEADMSVFTPRELKIINNLCDIYRDATASQMTEITHLPKEPWETTKKIKGLFERIDYLLSIDDTSPLSLEEAEERLTEHFEMLTNFGLSPMKVK